MKIRKIDHVSVVVNDLPAAKAFFLALGFGLQWEGEMQGELVDRVVGLHDVKSAVVFMGLPEGQTKLELVRFHTPSDESVQRPAANTLGIRHIAFLVDDIEAVVAKLKERGGEMFSEVQTYENIYKLCYVRGPEGIILELAEQIK